MPLFDGASFSGWTPVPSAQAWNVRDGMISCSGEPLGFLHTAHEFVNFRLEVEYRWTPGSKPGNSGIFSRIQNLTMPLPPCVEVQLMHGNAGDVLGLQGYEIAEGQDRFFHVANHAVAGDIDGVKKLSDQEAAAGKWNHVVIEASGPEYRVWVNGTLVNQVRGVAVASGPIGLQSEGGAIEFRSPTITVLP